MQQRKITGAVVMIVLGGLAALFALFGLLAAVAVAASPDADTAYSAGSAVGVLFWAAVSALLLVFGIRKLLRINRQNAQLPAQGTQGH
jgi:hypothetical protein